MPDPLIVDTELQAEVIRQFNLRGELSPFLLTNRVVPIFDIGRLASINTPQVVTTLEGSQGVRPGTPVGTTYLPTALPFIDDGDVSNSGAVVNPAAAAVILDGGAVTGAGIRQIYGIINWNTAEVDFQLEWRDAANAVTIALFSWFVGTGNASASFLFMLNMAGGERVRIVTATGGTGTADATLVVNSTSPSIAS